MTIKKETRRGETIIAAGLCNVIRIDHNGNAILAFGDCRSSAPRYEVSINAGELGKLLRRKKELLQQWQRHMPPIG